MRFLLLSLLLLGCREKAAGEERALVVFAASSLREAFTQLGDDFRGAHPGVELTFNFAGSQELRIQLEHGARADVFASADERHLEALRNVSAPVRIARNELVLVVSTERAASLTEFSQLPSARRVVLGAPEVPVGRYTQQMLARASKTLGDDFAARVEQQVVSRELNVRQVLNRVSLNEAEAGVVYRTDARFAGSQVAVVAIPPEFNVLAEYPMAVVTDAAHPRLAKAWVELVTGPVGLRVLAERGFLPPDKGRP